MTREEALTKIEALQLDGDTREALSVFIPELKVSEDERIRKNCIHFLNLQKSHHAATFEIEECIAWLEKQGELKSTNTEPKFKVGDWIVTPTNETKQIERVTLGNYRFTDETFYNIIDVDNKGHLWTIQDAKDGDVLTCYSDIKGQPIVQTGIIKQYVGRHGGCSNSFKAHFGIDWDNNVVIEGYMGSSNIYPATKEQRDLLFQKMKDAGYGWNEGKKELNEVTATGYVDLGLSSGTLWKSVNEEGYYTYDDAVKKFSNQIPSKEQWEELKNECKWEWGGFGYHVTGPNGKYIFLTANGFCLDMHNMYDEGTDGYYWSGTHSDENDAWNVYFEDSGFYLGHSPRYYERSVRLVK